MQHIRAFCLKMFWNIWEKNVIQMDTMQIG